MAKEYQLVLQFPEEQLDFDKIEELENLFSEKFPEDSFDGNDIGSGEINFFFLTKTPLESLEKLKALLNRQGAKSFSAGYRQVGEDEYLPVHPKNLKKFEVKWNTA